MGLHGLTYSDAALESLVKVQPKKVRKQIAKKIDTLARKPRQSGIKKVKGHTNGLRPIFRIRVGDYRVVYTLREGPHVIVLAIGHRKDIYRHW